MEERSPGSPTSGVVAEGDHPRFLQQAVPPARRERGRRGDELVVWGRFHAPAEQAAQAPATATPAAEAETQGTSGLPKSGKTSASATQATSSARAAIDTAIEFSRRGRGRAAAVRRTVFFSRGGASSTIRLWKR